MAYFISIKTQRGVREVLKVCNVTKKFRKVKANDNISCMLEGGQIGVLLGLNGAGKSTLIKCICGLLNFRGDITVGGFDCRTDEAKKLIGYVPETPALYDYLTVDEHLEFIQRAYKCKNEELKRTLLDMFELTDKTDKLGKELSKGMQQKLSICCALIHEPKLVIFDEPMVGLDPYAIKTLKNLFLELKKKGVCVLISTHMIDSVENYWDKAFILSKGELKAEKEYEEGILEDVFFSIASKEK